MSRTTSIDHSVQLSVPRQDEEQRVQSKVVSTHVSAKNAHQRYRHAVTHEVVARTLVGAGSSALINPILAPVGAAVGALTGAVPALAEYRGTVEIEVDGKSRTDRWYLTPDQFERRPDEARAELIAEGTIGRRIVTAPPPHVPSPSHTKALEVKPFGSQLGQLAKQRRLVADYGHTSENQPVVQLVPDGVTARNILASNIPLYVVVGKSSDEQPHHYAVTATNWAKTRQLSRESSWVERHFQYDLQPLNGCREVWPRLPEGAGLPSGMSAILRDAKTTSELVANLEQEKQTTVIEIPSEIVGSSSVRMTTTSRDPSVGLKSSGHLKAGMPKAEFRSMLSALGMGAGMFTALLATASPAAALGGAAIGWLVSHEGAVAATRESIRNSEVDSSVLG